MFNLDARGAGVDFVQVGNTFETKALALAEARDLRLGTHFRITDDGGNVVMEDSVERRYQIVATNRRTIAKAGRQISAARLGGDYLP